MNDWNDWTLIYEVRPGKWIEKKFDTAREMNAFSNQQARERRERMEALKVWHQS